MNPKIRHESPAREKLYEMVLALQQSVEKQDIEVLPTLTTIDAIKMDVHFRLYGRPFSKMDVHFRSC